MNYKIEIFNKDYLRIVEEVLRTGGWKVSTTNPDSTKSLYLKSENKFVSWAIEPDYFIAHPYKEAIIYKGRLTCVNDLRLLDNVPTYDITPDDYYVSSTCNIHAMSELFNMNFSSKYHSNWKTFVLDNLGAYGLKVKELLLENKFVPCRVRMKDSCVCHDVLFAKAHSQGYVDSMGVVWDVATPINLKTGKLEVTGDLS